MPGVDHHPNSCCCSSSGSSTSSLSSPRVPPADLSYQSQIHTQGITPTITSTTTIPPTTVPTTTTTTSHICLTRYKTELCRPFTETGKCKYGDKCQFSHGIKELRIITRHPKYKTEYCRTFHTSGYCPYGPRCHFIHDVHEARTTTNTGDSTTMRRHSEVRSTQPLQRSITRNRINSDYASSRTYSEQSSSLSMNNNNNNTYHHSSKLFSFPFEQLNRALLSFGISDVYRQQHFHQQEQQQQQSQFSPSSLLLPSMTNTTTIRRTFSSSSSSNSSLAPQYA